LLLENQLLYEFENPLSFFSSLSPSIQLVASLATLYVAWKVIDSYLNEDEQKFAKDFATKIDKEVNLSNNQELLSLRNDVNTKIIKIAKDSKLDENEQNTKINDIVSNYYFNIIKHIDNPKLKSDYTKFILIIYKFNPKKQKQLLQI
jgi:hypothetical protein